MKSCMICNRPASLLFSAEVLAKYKANYLRCESCGFIFIENPYWLKEAYSDPITASDVGIVSRNFEKAQLVERLISRHFDPDREFVDYGGGYGLLVRILRDKGLDFYRYDKYSPNLFARGFDKDDRLRSDKFELLTAFEVFEHLPEPSEGLKEMLELSDTVFFTTTLQPEQIPRHSGDWNYFSPETGQHISFFTEESLKNLSENSGCFLHTDKSCLHIITRRKFVNSPLQTIMKRPLLHRWGKGLFSFCERACGMRVNKKCLIDQDVRKILAKNIQSGKINQD